MIQREDVRILLSYVPFKTDEDLGGTQSVMSMTSTNKEGMYDSTKQSFFTRKNDQDEIMRFVDYIFGSSKTTLSYEDYSQIN